MRSRRWRLPALILLAVAVAAAAWVGWQAWHVSRDLQNAQGAAERWRSSLQSGGDRQREAALTELRDSAASADSRTSGPTWSALTHLPLIGDDAAGVRALSSSLDVIAQDAVTPLSQTVDDLDGVVADGKIDLDAVADLGEPVGRAHTALVRADDQVAGLDSSGYVDTLRTRFDRYAALVHGLRSGLASADKAVQVLPAMAGAEGPRDYLLLFQNNAEIRATGGMPGSWALLHADNGRIEMIRQGSASDFPTAAKPVLQLTREEQAVYGKELGIYFQDPGWTFDFPRAAQLWHAHWNLRFPDTPIDGVVALDPVGMSYLLDGTGPVAVDGVTLTRDNAVEELLSKPYIDKGAAAQNQFFARAAKAILSAATSSLASPTAFVEGLNRAASEGRLLIASFDLKIKADLSGTRVEGALAGDDGSIPHVDVGLNDLTGSKMSYYLRFNADVEAMDCHDQTQDLAGTVVLNQVISPNAAARLPTSVTGGGSYGTDPGSQFVMVRLYGPYGGSIDRVQLNGRNLRDLEVRQISGRPVVNVDVLLSSRNDVVLSWRGVTGQGQTGTGILGTTPSIVPGSDRQAFISAC
ncbi:DUF4012 domain-containing protein [Nocardioides aquiterrae]|uniref:DUF4012 domain-containing protein n=1 Tax=Nocardioides aquiterrae TaxID=203799 RepID=A0ABN1UGU3_9ACTN